MQTDTTNRASRLGRATITLLVLLAVPVSLAACSATSDDKPKDIPDEYFRAPTYCPPVRIRGGTEVYTAYERGQEETPAFVRYQATITRTARECSKTADGFTIKVGVGGRAVAGPKGGAGTVTLPIRVAVTQQTGGVVFSELYKVPVNFAPPALGADFSHVVEVIPIKALPHERDFIVFVGFDEGNTG